MFMCTYMMLLMNKHSMKTENFVIFAIALSVCQFDQFGVEAFTESTDAYVMSALKEAWRNSVPSNWQTSTDPCGDRWDGINCTNGHVTVISLSSRGLIGRIPSDIGSLQNLEQLDLAYNKDLIGSPPASLGSLVNLRSLTLIGCGLTGTIPEELGNLVNLDFLALNSNNLTGTIPPTLGNLESLTWFDISDNQITGALPISNSTQSGLDRLLQTQHFHFSQNKLTGSIPSALFSPEMTLRHILFDSNEFYGSIPTTITEVKTLEALRLDRNSFSGKIPSNITDLESLSELNLSNNELNDTIPDLSNMTSLQYMDLSNNTFQKSEFPNWLQSMKNLGTISLEKCSLTGEIPQGVFDIPSLETINLRENRLNGSVDINSAETSHLEVVNLENNLIIGATSSDSVTLLLQGNPHCEDSTSSSYSVCQSRSIQEGTYETSQECGDVGCKRNLELNPQTCDCQQPYSGHMIFKAPSFSGVSNKTRFKNLEYQFIKQLKIGGVSLKCHNFDANSYLIVQVKFYPLNGSTSFTESDSSTIAYLVAKHDFHLPPEFGPYVFLADQTSKGEKRSGLSKGAIVGIMIAGVVLVVTCVSAIVFALKQKRRADKAIEAHKPFAAWTMSRNPGGFPAFKGARFFTFEEMKKITNDFSQDNVIGRGGYGMVYKAMIEGGQMVAIKRAKQGSLQGAPEFRNEIELLSRVHHKNLVGLVGFCFDQEEQMLVYEYIPNGTLREALHGMADFQLSWTRRVHIALDSATGLTYLHELVNPPIIHRDVKADNILLDKNLVAKVADFGLSKLFDNEVEKGYVSSQVKGTMGYLDPQYYMTQKVSEKSDVYSLGIVMLELVTGHLPIQDGRHIVRVVKEALARGGLSTFREKLLDPVLRKRSKNLDDLQGLETFLDLALTCTEDEDAGRPFMRTVVKELENILETIGEISMQVSRNPSFVKTQKLASAFYANLDIETGDSSSSGFKSQADSSVFSYSGHPIVDRHVEPK